MLSESSRLLTYALAALYAILGLALFVFPARLAPLFAWNISPFVAMTIGGWCLGNAWAALVASRRWRWSQVYAVLIYLWLFGLLQLVVVFLFRDKLRLEHPIAWLYLLVLLTNVTAAILGITDLFRLRPPWTTGGRAITPFIRLLIILFVVFVGFLGFYGLFAQEGWPGTRGGIFPELMSPFTLRSFGAFYLSLALATAMLWIARRFESFLTFIFAEMGLVIAITLAALRNIKLFDFATRPGGLAYVGVYVVVGAVMLALMWKYGTHEASSA
jgi:hypothetical protein